MSFTELPAYPKPATMKIRPRQRTKSSQAMNGKILTSEYGGHVFELTLTYAPMLRSDAADLMAFLHAMRGRGGIFLVPLDPPTGQGGVRVGNFAKFSNDTKIHVITATSPAVVVSPPARVPGGTLSTGGLKMRCSLTSDLQVIDLGANGLVRLELDLIERV